MKILIAGGGAFCERLVAEFTRNRHQVYLIDDSPNERKYKCVKYNFDLDNERLNVVFESVEPDVVIFLGAMSDNYDWTSPAKTSAKFMAGLSNILCNARNICKFIYISSTDIYGRHHGQELHESIHKNPEDIKSLIILQGEAMCAAYESISPVVPLALRFSNVYGMITAHGNDFALRLFRDAMETGTITTPKTDTVFTVTHVNDAVDAVHKVVCMQWLKGGAFNIAGTNVSMTDVCQNIANLTSSNLIIEQNESPDKILTVNGNSFSAFSGYTPIKSLPEGLALTYKLLLGGEKRKAKKKQVPLLKLALPFVETFSVFILFSLIVVFTADNHHLSAVNFMMIYIVLIAVNFGLLQASLAVILASIFSLWTATGYMTPSFAWISDYPTVLMLLQFLVIGTICGYIRDQLNNRADRIKRDVIELNAELETLHDINNKNVYIKQHLDYRLTHFENSLAWVQMVTERVNSLNTVEILLESAGVISQIINTKDARVYSGENDEMLRLISSTAKCESTMRIMPALHECIKENRIFVNTTADKYLPAMAAPVYVNGNLSAVFMVFEMEFENLTPYSRNTFAILCKIISSAMEKSYLANEPRYIPNTSILTPKAYNDMLAAAKNAAKDGTAPYCTFELDTAGYLIEEVHDIMHSKLRATDCIGQTETGAIHVLLTSTPPEDAAIFPTWISSQIGGMELRKIEDKEFVQA